MKTIPPENEFTEPTDQALLKSLDDEPLVVHQKSKSNKALIIFVHGLGGSRYGEDSTWGNFPKFIYDELPQFDIGLYEFRSLMRRAKFWKSVRLSDEAEVFADIIRDIGSYQTIILVGHSMGGLLCMAAIVHLVDTRQCDVLRRVGGLILMATPQTGSQRVPTLLSYLSKDFRALKPHGEFVRHLQDTLLNSKVILDETRAQAGDILIPTWAVLGDSDYWVDKLSAGLNLPATRKKTVRGTHTEIVKPQSKEFDAYQYVRDRIQEAYVRLHTTVETPFSRQNESLSAFANDSEDNDHQLNERAPVLTSASLTTSPTILQSSTFRAANNINININVIISGRELDGEASASELVKQIKKAIQGAADGE